MICDNRRFIKRQEIIIPNSGTNWMDANYFDDKGASIYLGYKETIWEVGIVEEIIEIINATPERYTYGKIFDSNKYESDKKLALRFINANKDDEEIMKYIYERITDDAKQMINY